MNYEELKAAIKAEIRENGIGEITGLKLQAVLLEMVEQLGDYGVFAGVATPETVPPSNAETDMMYVANKAGSYANFGNGINLANGEVALLTWNGTTGKKVLSAQAKTDSSLDTISKDIVGAINEVFRNINILTADKQDKEDDSLETDNKTIVGAINNLSEEKLDKIVQALKGENKNVISVINGLTDNKLNRIENGIAGDDKDVISVINSILIVMHNMDLLIKQKQDRNDEGLETYSKYIVNAINEVNRLAKENGNRIDVLEPRLSWAEMGNIPQWAKDSLVCYYDVMKQGCTNAMMKANPFLHDFTPNHFDLQLKNFTWKGNSGVGGYADYSTGTFLNGVHSDNTITVNPQKPYDSGVLWNLFSGSTLNYPVHEIEIFGLQGTNKLEIKDVQGSRVIEKDGIYEVNFGKAQGETYFKMVYDTFEYSQWKAFKIYIKPKYPNYLTFAAGNFGVCEGLPSLKDYTCMANRIWIDTIVNVSNVFSKKEYSFEIESFAPNDLHCNSFGQKTGISVAETNKRIMIQSKNAYAGRYIASGTQADRSILNIASAANKSRMAIRQYALFNRTLNPEEQAWAEDNLMGNGELLLY